MASRTIKEQRGQDGAKPGAEARTPADRHAFDADGRAEAREGAPITIGGQTFHRVRRNWAVIRKVRGLLRDQEKAAQQTRRYEVQISAKTEAIAGVLDPQTGDWKTPPVTDDAELARIDAEIEELYKKSDKANEDADTAAFKIVVLLLRGDGDEPGPDIRFLQESCDFAEVGALAAVLAGGEEPAEGPTPTESSSS